MNEFQVTSEEFQKNLKTKFVYIASFFWKKTAFVQFDVSQVMMIPTYR